MDKEGGGDKPELLRNLQSEFIVAEYWKKI